MDIWRDNMAEKVVVIFVEGDTEEKFYKNMLSILRNKSGGRFPCNVVPKNVKGVGNYKNKVGRIFEKKIKVDYPDSYYSVLLCYDSDVFELAQKPHIDWDDVIKDLKSKGANEVHKVLAKKSIEDWFLYDIQGILKYLGLSKDTKIPNGTGVKRLQLIFRKGSKTYIKGQRNDKFIECLDIEKILYYICNDIKNICMALGIDCKKEKKCLNKNK
jgi:hypothetical protein